MNTRKGMNGWKATSEYPLRDNLVLDVSTSKNGNGSLSTFISVSEVQIIDEATGLQSKTHKVFEDYAKSIRHTLEGNLTEKKVIKFHEEAVELVKSTYMGHALEHYKNIP